MPRATVVRLIARLNVGGPALHTILLTEGLKSQGFEPVLVTGVVSPGEGDMAPFARERGVVPIVVPQLQRNPRPLDDVRALGKILRVLFAARPVIIHTHTAKAGALGRLAGFVYNAWARATGRPRAVICHTFHGHLFRGYFSPWVSAVLIIGERILARATDRVLTVSAQMKEELTTTYRICPADKVVVVPVGLDFGWTEKLPTFRGQLRSETGVPGDCLAVGIVGRLTAIKNHELFLMMASACRVPAARFFVIGDGERRRELMDLANRLRLDGHVTFTGWQRDPAKIYADLDVACLTSLNEGTPLALIEAMAAGVPVVATKVGGVHDLMVGERTVHAGGFELFSNGILVPSNQAEAFSAAVEFLAGRPDLRRQMAVAGQRFARTRFSVERLVSEMGALYWELLAPRGDGSCQ